uniref:Uncharacterized protein n=1 Tax=Leersia perrieri TaxID=77586 RepID=A0A0D9X520_9ORYZ
MGNEVLLENIVFSNRLMNCFTAANAAMLQQSRATPVGSCYHGGSRGGGWRAGGCTGGTPAVYKDLSSTVPVCFHNLLEQVADVHAYVCNLSETNIIQFMMVASYGPDQSFCLG